jgi:hypothetical protein
MGEGDCDFSYDLRNAFGGGGMGCSTCIWVLGLFVRTACRCDLGYSARIPKIEGETGMTNTDTSAEATTAQDDYFDEITENGNARIDNIVLPLNLSERLEGHIHTQLRLAFEAGQKSVRAERDAAIARAEKAEARVSELEGALLDRITNIGVAWSDSFENQLDQAKNIARAALSREPTRCAECDCDNPPDGCNWIKAEEPKS